MTRSDRVTFLDAVMDIPVEHKKDTFVAIHLHEYRMDTKRVKMVDIRYWHAQKDGSKTMGKGTRFPLEYAEQLAHRLLRLTKRYCKPESEDDDGLVEEGFSQASRIGWEGE